MVPFEASTHNKYRIKKEKRKEKRKKRKRKTWQAKRRLMAVIYRIFIIDPMTCRIEI